MKAWLTRRGEPLFGIPPTALWWLAIAFGFLAGTIIGKVL